MRRTWIIGLSAIGILAVLIGAGFGLLQTDAAKARLAQIAARQLSSPRGTAKVGAISGLIPFDMRVSRIELADVAGPWMTIDNGLLNWSPSSLLTGRLRIDRLAADRIVILHSPAPSGSNGSTGFSFPQLPVGIDLRMLEVGQLLLDPALTDQDNAGAHIAARGMLGRGRADLNLRLTRIDNQPGFAVLDTHYDQAADQLSLYIDLSEPTGLLLDEALRRTDKLPLRITVKGGGPLAGWKGQIRIAAGDIAHADSALEIAQTKGSRVALTGTAAIAALLPEAIRPMIGDAVTFQIVGAEDGAKGMMLAPSHITLAGMTITASGSRSDQGALSGNAHIAIADLTPFEKTVGPASGTIDLEAALSGTTDHHLLDLSEKGRVAIGQIALDGLSLNARVEGKDKNDSADVTLDARAENVHDLVEGGADYGTLTIHGSGSADSSGRMLTVTEFTATGPGIDFKGNGSLRNGVAQGNATLNAGDLSVAGKILGMNIGGASAFTVKAETRGDKTVTLQLTGSGDRLRSGIPAVDALLSGHVALEANGTRSADGKIALSKFTLNDSRAKLEGSGAFDPADQTIAANITGNLADLGSLSGALQSPLAGTGSVAAKIGGTLDQPGIDARATLDRLAFGAMRIDHLDAKILAPQGLNGIATMSGRIVSGKLNQTIDAAIKREGDRIYRLSKLTMAGAGGTMNGAMLADLGRNRISGRLNADIADLSLWSGVVGEPLSGKIAVSLDIPTETGRQGPVKATIDHLTYGANPGSIGIAHAALNGKLSGDLNRPNAAVDLALTGLTAGGASLSAGTVSVTSLGTKADFKARLAGKFQEQGMLDLAGSLTRNRDNNIVQLTSLNAASGAHKLSLTRPVTITVAPGAYALAGLALTADGGTVEGDASLNSKRVSADIRLRLFPLHPFAVFATGKDAVGGTLDGRVTLDGTPARPTAKIVLTTKGLDLQTDGPLPRPALNLSLDAGWQGERADLNVKLSSGTGETLNLTGSAPFAFDLATLSARRPANSALALKLTGGGKIENLTSIIPLGEDRMTGAFTVDVAVGGTLDSPLPTGSIAVTDGNYANMALGTQLSHIDLALRGAGERFVLDHLTATDAASGKLNASGAIDLGVSPATVSLDLGFTDFLVARSDDATINADGALKLAGTLAAMKVGGRLTVRHAELYIPDRLPASVVSLDVIEIGGKQKAETPNSKPLAPINLDIALDAPGQIFVRGHGVTSEWRGHTDIGGTTAGPVMAGQLSVVNGTIDLLGQTFTINRGEIGFGGGTDINPTVALQASATASSITANVNVTGTARAPKIALSSTPALPQDEILSRILFGANVGSLTASQGLQLAQAAATLAQGGPGVLDRVRSSIGLDRLDLTAGGSNATGTQGAAKGTTVSGGKYIANGVFVGVAQGASTNSSQAKVEVEITPHISVNSTFGTASGSGFGAKYSVDY